MSDAVATVALPARPNLDSRPHISGPLVFGALLAVGVAIRRTG